MRKKLLGALVVLGLVAVPALAVVQTYANNAASITATSSSYRIVDNVPGGNSAEFTARYVFAKNAGANEMFCHARDGANVAATTASVLIEAGEAFTFTGGGIGFNSISCICSGGETTTARFIAQND